MPQATDEQRARWDGPGEEAAMRFLRAAGYELLRDWTWLPPRGHEPTERELDAVDFLIDEWDFGGLAEGPHPPEAPIPPIA